MADEETGEIFNKAITALAPEAVDIVWPELKNSTEEQVKEVCLFCFNTSASNSQAPLTRKYLLKTIEVSF